MTGIIVRLPDGYQTLYSGDTLTIGDLRLEVLVTSAGVHLNVLSDAPAGQEKPVTPETEPDHETAGALLDRLRTDGAKWAAEWHRTARRILTGRGMTANGADDTLSVLDEGWMIGWFANAIEAGRAEGYFRGRREMVADIRAAGAAAAARAEPNATAAADRLTEDANRLTTLRAERGQARETHPEEWAWCPVHQHHFPLRAMDGRPCTPTTSRLADVDETAGGT